MITITPTPQQFSGPPPLPNLSVPPPGHRFPPPQRFHGPGRHAFFQPFRPYGRGGVAALDPEFDGKRLRKSAMRKTVDYNSAIIKMLESRVWQRDFRDRRSLQPDTMYIPDLQPPPSYEDNAINAVTTRFVKAATNKMRCPIFCMAWTPEGRRLVTGASSGEFTLWNGLTFNFETILQAHDSPVRTMVWSHNDVWMVTADHAGYVKYWQSNMNNVKMFLAHKEAIRGISFSPNDSKFATCSDDGTIRIWDFLRCQEERILRGHGADVKCVHWHPQKGLIISGSKDNQQPVKLWDPKTGQSLATLHAHKSTVMDIKWNNNGNWLITASRDHLLKLFDIRNLSSEVQTFRGHKKESSSVAWHPYHEGLFCSGGSDGAILFWHVGADKEVGAIEQAHDSIVWTLAWHPLGHILCSGSNDHSSKFWTRNRPGDQMRDKYNLNTLPSNLAGFEDNEIDDVAMIPGMGPEDKVETAVPTIDDPNIIPGLDIDSTEDKSKTILKKVPYSKPIPKNFQAQWNHSGAPGEAIDEKDGLDAMTLLNQLIEKQPGATPLSEVEPESIYIFGKMIDVIPGSQLQEAIKGGAEALFRLINSGAIEELHDVMPHIDLRNDDDNFEPEPSEDAEVEEEESWNGQEDEDFRFKGMQDQDMRHFMQPPPQFGSDIPLGTPPLDPHRIPPKVETRPLMDIDSRLPPNSDMFRPSNMDINKQDLFRQLPMQDLNRPHNEMFRTQDISRPNFTQDLQRPGVFPSRDLPRLSDFRLQNDEMRRFHGDSFRQDNTQRRRDLSPPNIHRNNNRSQGFMGSENDDSISSYNQLDNDRDRDRDRELRTPFGNGDYHDESRQWHGDNENRDDWEEDMDDDFMERRDNDGRDYDERRRYPPSRSKFPRSHGRGKPRGGGFDRGRRGGGSSRGRGSPRGGRGSFRSRGQRSGRKTKH